MFINFYLFFDVPRLLGTLQPGIYVHQYCFPPFGLYGNIIHVKYLFMYYQCIYLCKIYFYTCTRDLYFFIFLHIPFLYSYYILFNLLHFYPSISPTHILQFLYILILSWIPIFLPYTFLNPIHFHIPIIYVFQFIPF